MESQWAPDGSQIELHLITDERYHLFQVAFTLCLLVFSVYIVSPFTNPIGFWLPESIAMTAFGIGAVCAFVDYLFSATMISVDSSSGQVAYRRFLKTRSWGALASIESITSGWGRAYPVSIRIRGGRRELLIIDSPTSEVARWAMAVAALAQVQGHTITVQIEPKREIDRFEFKTSQSDTDRASN